MEPRMYTVTAIVRQKVAQEMTKRTPYTITADMVSRVKGDDMNVYVAQYGDVSVLCWVRPDEELIIRCVPW